MQPNAHQAKAAPGRDRAQFRRAMLILVTSAGLALVAAACGGSPASSGGPGNVTVGGSGSGGGSASGSGQKSTGSFSLAFAKCMRAHGVPNFPDPDGQSGQLGPDSGIDPNSPQFQAALNGPCESLAPASWVGSGKVTR